jgi:hypothetical protein
VTGTGSYVVTYRPATQSADDEIDVARRNWLPPLLFSCNKFSCSKPRKLFFFVFFCAPGICDWQGTRTSTLYKRRFASMTEETVIIFERQQVLLHVA